MANNVFTLYQTNEPNILGGLMTYNSLSEAMDHVGKMGCCGRRITKVYAVTYVNSEWWRGHYTGYLCEVLGKGLIYSID